MAEYQIMAWYGIPTGVRAKDHEGQVRQKLPLRFQAAVDAVATATGRTDTQAYLAGWQWSAPQQREGTAREVAEAIAAELIEDYPAKRVRQLCQQLEADLSQEQA